MNTPVADTRAASVTAAGRGGGFNVQQIRADFPILEREIKGRRLVYLDNAATAQKPRSVIDAVTDFYERHNANIHRGVHALSQEATTAYEAAREKVRGFLNAPDAREVIFVRGATEGINLVAQTFGRSRVSAGDEIVVSGLEHHSNIVPWQLLCEERRAELRVLPILETGDVDVDRLRDLLTPKTRILAVAHVSNALGTVNPLATMIRMARERGVTVVVDGAQAAPHLAVDVQTLDCDFYAISGHKMFGPTGVGALFGRAELLEAMPPWQGGGDMIRTVSFAGTAYAPIPAKFEAGTPNVAGVIGLGAAVDYLAGLPWDQVQRHEHELVTYAVERIRQVRGVQLIGTPGERVGVVSFVMEGVHPHDLGTLVDGEGVAIRTGHHCAQPVMEFFGVPATARASIAFYNTREEIDRLVDALEHAREVLA